MLLVPCIFKNMQLSVEIKNLTKEFKRGQKSKTSLKEYFVNPFHKVEQDVFCAVNDLNFEIKQGEFFGIIGRNGSGKSTLLKLIAGILNPTHGEVILHGKIVPFLELGVGFNPELTARENVFLNGAILGMTRKQLEEKFDEIIEFAEVGEFVDTQVKNFSSGMYVRLAFAIAIQAEADIYLVDEILAVGDFAFQQKCFSLFKKLKKSGKTFIFVSHDLASVREFCDRSLYIKNGKLKNLGNTDSVIKDYILHDRQEQDRGKPISNNKLGRDTDEGGKMTIKLLDEDGRDMEATMNNKPFTVRIEYELRPEVLNQDLIIGFGIYKDGDNFIFGTNSLIENKKINFKENGVVEFVVKDFPLLYGHYGVSAAIHNKENVHHVWRDNAVEFDVVKSTKRDGLFNLDIEIVDHS